MNDIFNGVGIKVNIINPENFRKIVETLTRIGVAAKNEKRLYQSCHILHKRDREGNSHYAIVHFKEMFKLDGKPTNLAQTDLDRAYLIACLLEQWNLVKIIDKELLVAPVTRPPIKIISFSEKAEWELVAKYQIGKKGKQNENSQSNNHTNT